MSLFGDVLSGLRTLVFPEICIVCGEEFESICQSCISPWNRKAHHLQIDDLRISAVLPYDSSSSKIILKAKEDRNKPARKLMSKTLTTSIASWRNIIDLSQVILVPIPSTKAAIRRRGEAFLLPILDNAVKNLERKFELRMDWVELLVHQKRVRDQSELSFHQRVINLYDAFTLKEDLRATDFIKGRQIILIDDVVTTGATLLSAARALRERKMTVFGAATVCASSHRLLIR